MEALETLPASRTHCRADQRLSEEVVLERCMDIPAPTALREKRFVERWFFSTIHQGIGTLTFLSGRLSRPRYAGSVDRVE